MRRQTLRRKRSTSRARPSASTTISRAMVTRPLWVSSLLAYGPLRFAFYVWRILMDDYCNVPGPVFTFDSNAQATADLVIGQFDQGGGDEFWALFVPAPLNATFPIAVTPTYGQLLHPLAGNAWAGNIEAAIDMSFGNISGLGGAVLVTATAELWGFNGGWSYIDDILANTEPASNNQVALQGSKNIALGGNYTNLGVRLKIESASGSGTSLASVASFSFTSI